MEMFLTNFPLERSPETDHSWENMSPWLLALLAWSETNKSQFRLEAKYGHHQSPKPCRYSCSASLEASMSGSEMKAAPDPLPLQGGGKLSAR